MLNVKEILGRVGLLAGYTNMKPSDWREVDYVQKFTPATGGEPTAAVQQPFPTGAIICAVLGSAFVPNGPPLAFRGRQCFTVDFSFTGGETWIIGGPVLADALLGGGDAATFPLKEQVMAPNQMVLCRVGNVTNGALEVHIVYRCLIYRLQG